MELRDNNKIKRINHATIIIISIGNDETLMENDAIGNREVTRRELRLSISAMVAVLIIGDHIRRILMI